MRTATAFTLLAILAFSGFCFGAEPLKPVRLDAHGDPLPDKALLRLGSVRFQLQELERGFVNERVRYQVVDRERATAISPDGSTIVIPGSSYKYETPLYFIDTKTGKCRRGPIVDKIQANQIRYSLDGKTLLLTAWSAGFYVDSETGRVEKSFEFDDLSGPLAVSHDGKLVAAQVGKSVVDASVVVLEADTRKEIAKLPGRGSKCEQLAFGPDSKLVLLLSEIPHRDKDGQLWYGGNSKVALTCIDVAERKIIASKEIGNAQRVAFAPDGETAAIEAADHQNVQVVHLPSKGNRCVIDVPSTEFMFAPDGKSVLIIDDARQCSLWDSATGKKIRDLDGALANRDNRVLGFSKDGKFIAAIDGGWESTATIVVWHAATGKRVGRPPGHEGAVTCLAYTSDGKQIISGSLDRTVRLWNCSRGEHVRVVAAHNDPITAIAISPDDTLVASSSQSGAILVSRIADGKTVAELTGLNKGAHALAFSADGSVVVAGSKTPEVFGWNIATRERVVRTKVGVDGEIMGFGSGGGLLAVGNGWFRGEKQKFELWKTTDRQPMASMMIGGEIRDGDIRCERIVFSPEGRVLASSQVSEYQGIRPSYGAAQLRIWECSTGQAIRTLAPTITKAIAFSPNGRLLASGGTGRSGHLSVGYGPGIDIWDTVSGDKIAELDDSPNCVTFSPNGRHLASAGRDGCILIFESPSPHFPCNAKVSDDVRDAWWPALGEETKVAYDAIAQMVDSPEQAVALLRQRIQPISRADAETVAKHIKQLDSAKFTERENAQRELIRFGDGVLDLLSKSMKGELSAEARRRLDDIVAKLKGTTTHTLQQHRAIAVLEWIGTPAAKEHLQSIAKGAPGARLTVEAEAAVRRMINGDRN